MPGKKPVAPQEGDRALGNRVNKMEIEKGIENGINKWIRTVCITSTTATFGFFMWLGSLTYDKYPAFKAAIIAFIQADKGIK